ncbi:hypothetical protein HDV00_006120 [Rhizophlyctis rosea]|nr:hypothetical protein HDV00_006120 [Rhizophlyctis rosea]
MKYSTLGIHELKKHQDYLNPAYSKDMNVIKSNCLKALDELDKLKNILVQQNADAEKRWKILEAQKRKYLQSAPVPADESRRSSQTPDAKPSFPYELPAIEKDNDQWWRTDGVQKPRVTTVEDAMKKLQIKSVPQAQPQHQYPNIPPTHSATPPALPPKPSSTEPRFKPPSYGSPSDAVFIPPRSTSHEIIGPGPAFHPPPPPTHPPPSDVRGPPPAVPKKPAGAAMVLMTDEQSALGGTTEGGVPLRTVHMPEDVLSKFLKIAESNTKKNLETCGILCGKLSKDQFYCTTLVIPKQTATSDTCTTTDEVELFEYQDKEDLISLGWIHTHPTQTCFMSSVDLHTHCAYQLMLPEAIAIVLAPRHMPDHGIFRLTDPPGLDVVMNCMEKSAFHPHPDTRDPLYRPVAEGFGSHVRLVPPGKGNLKVVDLR